MARKLRIGLVVAVGVLLLLVILVALIPIPQEELQNSNIPQFSTTEPDNSGPTRLGQFTADPRESVTPTSEQGVLEGSVDHLDGTVPSGMKICAVNQQSFKETCTQELFESTLYPTGYMYRLRVDPGKYTVYAQAPGSDYRAYYTIFAQCGHRAECDDHTPLVVTVAAKEIVPEINPQDWYDPK